MLVLLPCFTLLAPLVTLFSHNYLPAPEDAQTDTIIEDILVSRAAYRELTEPNQIDVYRFTAQKGDEIYVSMLVPAIDTFMQFRPVFAFTTEVAELMPRGGEQERTGGTNSIEQLPRAGLIRLKRGLIISPADIPSKIADTLQALSILTIGSDGTEDRFFEPFTGTTYIERQEVVFHAPAEGIYRILVFSAEGETGKYILAPGRKEKFSLGDILELPATRIKVRRFMEESVVGDYIVWSVIGAGVLGALSYGIVKLATTAGSGL